MDHIRIPVICLEAVLALTDDERGRLLEALLRYGGGEGPAEPGGKEHSLYLVLRAQMDRDLAISRRRAEAGRRGGQASARKSGRVAPMEEERGRGAMKRPTVEEVGAYCAERGNGIDPRVFVDFYASKGWLVGKTPMRDWRAAVRTWESKRKQEGGEARGEAERPNAADAGGFRGFRARSALDDADGAGPQPGGAAEPAAGRPDRL